MKNQKKYTRILLILPLVILPAMLLSACGTEQTPPSSDVVDVILTSEAVVDGDEPAAEDIAEAVVHRTPIPTSAPTYIDLSIDDISKSLGLDEVTFLGLTFPDWINLGISILIILVGYFLGDKLVIAFLKWVLGRISADPDEAMILTIKEELKWLVVILSTRFAFLRLTFLSDRLRTGIDDILFILELVIFTIIGIRLIDIAFETFKGTVETEDDLERMEPILNIAKRVSNFVIGVVVLSLGLSHFGLSINTLSLLIFSVSAILALGAQDIISDVISGFIIMVDQTFHVADRIYIKELETWGDIIKIGPRTTVIHMHDNREVTIPNSQLANSQVVNYTVLGPSFRLQTDIGVAYGSDIDKVRTVVEDAVRGIEGVVQEKPVDVLFLEFGDTTRSMRVRWWIDHYEKKNPMMDKVNAALEIALEKAEIDMPFNTVDLNVKMKDDHPDPSAPADQAEE